METYHIHIKGRVQGVGFRPFVYKLANSAQINGWVCNATDGVHIRFNAVEQLAGRFYKDCLDLKPSLAVITDSRIDRVDQEQFAEFEIVESQNHNLSLNISPDFSLCSKCREELRNKNNRRNSYSFITCTHCGPRYSILTGLPYDRPLTSMKSFAMCEACEMEYENPADRRYFSQTNSCESCGVQLSFSDSEGPLDENLGQKEILSLAVEKLKSDFILAVKGIGGFLLLTNANNRQAVERLRILKKRPSKPFAVLYEDLNKVREYFNVNPEEEEQLMGAVSPIVLLSPNARNELPIDKIAPNLDKIGVMIPYVPILQLIATQFKEPLIATSANLSGEPIVHGEDEARLFEIADFVLSNNRQISFPQDDSVAQITPAFKQKIILRRSRGLAPSIFTSLPASERDTLTLGAEIKGTFALSVKENTFVSQYLGNLSHYENQVQYQNTLDRFIRLVAGKIEHVVIDAHPGYFTHQLGMSIAEEKGILVEEVQHHEAHFAAILAESTLIEQDHVLGVIWDGTGFGHDGNAWGGEFFNYSDGQISRIAHLDYFHNLSGDRMARDNRLCALSLSGEENGHNIRDSFSSIEWDYYTKSLQRPGTMTSSMGRVFDAMAYFSGISTANSYEGESAMLLEQEARKAFRGSASIKPYSILLDGEIFSFSNAVEEIYSDRENNPKLISARFHLTLVEMVRSLAIRDQYQIIAFSGGVFQNALLVDLLIDRLGHDFQLHFHKELSPNDENISFGQLAHLKFIQNKEIINLKSVGQCA